MAGEGQLAAGREDAQAGAVPRLVGRQHEHGLGEVELAGDRLHRRRVEPFGIQHHGERVAGKRPIGEHVEGDEAAGHGASWRPPLRAGEADTAIAVPVRNYSLTGSAVTPHLGVALPAPARGQNLALWRPLRNEFGAASRRSLALGPGSHSAVAACARESRGESCAQTLNRAFPEACNGAKRSERLSGTQRNKLPRSGAESHLSRGSPLGEVGKSISTTIGQWSLAFGRSQPTRG